MESWVVLLDGLGNGVKSEVVEHTSERTKFVNLVVFKESNSISFVENPLGIGSADIPALDISIHKSRVKHGKAMYLPKEVLLWMPRKEEQDLHYFGETLVVSNGEKSEIVHKENVGYFGGPKMEMVIGFQTLV
ncbi:hypothetical protein KY285_001892 [Solanum tuberosum]|nr:hypothetical protein KY284_002048 [Solanum tuberosum]KAH0766021.1 hypothetical protein KY285_001892 [Solanum tuberosum]